MIILELINQKDMEDITSSHDKNENSNTNNENENDNFKN